MIENKKITVCTPIRNEEFFLQFYLPCVKEIADELIIIDGGSVDSSVDMIHQFMSDNLDMRVCLVIQPQRGNPYSDDWNEGEVRNKLLELSTGDYIIPLDADEYIERHSVERGVRIAEENKYTLISYKMIPFWGDLHHVRVNGPDDARWFNVNLARIIKAGVWEYSEDYHHCTLQHKSFGRGSEAFLGTTAIQYPLYHLHYGFGVKGVKFRDNRRGDLGNPDAIDEKRSTPIFSGMPNVYVARYYGPWPSILEPYLENK